MEDRKNSRTGRTKSTASLVVRQFSSSRIEKLLLTRLFDLVEGSGGTQAERLVRPTSLLASDVLPIPLTHNYIPIVHTLRKGA